MLFAKYGPILVKNLFNMPTIFRPVISLSSTIKVFGYMGGCLLFVFKISFNTFQVYFLFLSLFFKRFE